MSEPIVFLDIDGVLNHARWYAQLQPRLGTTKPVDWIDPACVARLNRLCADTGAAIVVTSSWRTRLEHTETVLREAGLTAPVVGATPDANPVSLDDPLRTHRGRAYEIQAWLRKHPRVRRYVILDDLKLRRVRWSRFVRTDLAVGLTDADCAKARAILARTRAHG